ncbi:MAG: hypothetical protein JO147_11360 [Actinobacteria bacterium]|nr:hypothetical protein [Actinomycetota bacterium]
MTMRNPAPATPSATPPSPRRQWRDLATRYVGGESLREIADRYGVDPAVIAGIIAETVPNADERRALLRARRQRMRQRSADTGAASPDGRTARGLNVSVQYPSSHSRPAPR